MAGGKIAEDLKRPARLTMLIVGALVVAILVAACSSDDDAPGGAGGGGSLAGLTQGDVESLARSAALGIGFNGGGSSGIHVTGVGVANATADIAVLSVGVEAFAKTVTEARDTAAIAVNGMLASLRADGVSDEDMQTTSFNIQPEYTFEEVFVGPDGERVRRTERRLTGYRVTNTLSVKIRDLDALGASIDGTVDAGGDAARINNIRFTIDDGTPLEEAARLLALRDAVAKADLYAAETGVGRGTLVFISEASAPQFPQAIRLESADRAFAGAAPPTEIIGGDVDVRVTIQAVFAID
jgi:uncharacterized protein YggE